ncbi:MAG: phosphotransferase family protein [Candidatus Nanohalobium sp.]
MDDVEDKIHKVAGKHFDSSISGLEELSGGASHYTYLVSLSNREEYVFKLSNYDWSGLPDYENGFPIDGPILRFLSDIDALPTPEALFFDSSEEDFDFKHLVSEKVEGENLFLSWDKIDLSVVKDAGRVIAKMHEEIRFNNHGKLGYRKESEEVYVEETERWVKMFSDILHSLTDNLEETGFSEYRSEIRELFEENRHVLRERPPAVLVHQEFSPRNLIVRDSQIKGVLDWERSISADPEYDLFTAERHFTVKTNLFEGTSQTEEEIQEAFREGYREVRGLEDGWRKRRKIYHLAYIVHVMWVLDEEVESHDILEEYEKIKSELTR